MGQGLYEQSLMYCDGSRLLDRECQTMITKYKYSKLTGTPPYPSIDVTPARVIDAFFIIEEECQQKNI